VTLPSRSDDLLVLLDAPRSAASVPRTGLLARLSVDTDATVVVLSGPAGAGKTTTARQWAELDPRPHHLVRLAAHLDDPAVLAEAVLTALEAIGPREPTARASVTGQEPTYSSVVLPGLATLAASRSEAYVLVLDDVHLLHDPDCVRLVRTLADAVPGGSSLVLLSREASPTWVARLRAEGRLLELTTDDLAFNDEELEALLVSQGIGLRPADREQMLQRTEGWAVALYLEALALRQSRTTVPQQGGLTPVGDLGFARDYIESEVLDPLPPETRDFLVRTSILDDIEPAACDALLGRTDSAGTLDMLRRSTPLVSAVESEGAAYRYHHLLHDTLRAVLATTHDADTIAALHRRAAEWYDRHGDIDAAVRHSRLAGDTDATAGLIWPHVVFSVASGRPDRLARWLDDLGPQAVAANPWLSMAAAWSALQSADRDAMRHWILRSETHAGRGWRDRVAVDGYAATLATLTAIEGEISLGDGAELSRAALDGLDPDDPWRAVAAFIGAVCLTLLRDAEALPLLLEAQRLARAQGVHLLEADALAWRGMLSLLGGDLSVGVALIAESTTLVEEHNLERFVTSANAFTAQSLADSLRQDRDRAALALATARRLTVAGDGIARWFQVCGRLVQARAALNLGDAALAKVLLSEARSYMTDDLAKSAAQDMLDATEAVLASSTAQSSSVVPLTAAEMRVLQFLPSHLTFPQIGEHLFLSANTVKTHALSIYRKLGATSRNEAVTRAQALGLVEAPMRA
jgi:LuxR family maltose regulon positive regulatory protein